MRNLAFVFFIACQGCFATVGYEWYRPWPQSGHGLRADWSGLNLAIEPGGETGAEHLLRLRYRALLDQRPPASGAEPFRFRFERGAERTSNPWLFGPGLLLSGAVPGYWRQAWELRLTVTAPDGATFVASGDLVRRVATWLPFALVAPNYIVGVNSGESSDAEPDKLASTDELMARLLEAAEPFVEQHRPPSAK